MGRCLTKVGSTQETLCYYKVSVLQVTNKLYVLLRHQFGKFSVFAKDTVKMSETHADICKAFLVLYVIKVHIIPQFLYLIHTKCSGRCSKHEEEASDSKRETPEKTNKQSELSNEAEEKDYSDDQLPKYSSLSLA